MMRANVFAAAHVFAGLAVRAAGAHAPKAALSPVLNAKGIPARAPARPQFPPKRLALPCLIKLRPIPYNSFDSPELLFIEREDHEDTVGDVPYGPHVQLAGRYEPEAGVILRMAEHDNKNSLSPSEGGEAGFNELHADLPALAIRADGHRR